MREFRMIVSSPDGTLFDGDIAMLTLRGTEGELAVMAGHIPLVTSVVACDGKLIMVDETERPFHTGGGLLSVSSAKVTLLSGSFRWREE